MGLFDLGRPGQGIVQVMGPQLGIVLPGLTMTCGDSQTCTNGGLGSWWRRATKTSAYGNSRGIE